MKMFSSATHRMVTAALSKVSASVGHNKGVVISKSAARVVAAQTTRSFISATLPRLEQHTINVPTMGDSITEGTIVEWTAQVGQAIKEGDVVALVETDKVTIDIKAEIDGVLTQQFGAVDDTVEVGAALYELDTEAEATVVVDNAGGGDSTPAAAAEQSDDTPLVEQQIQSAPPPPASEAPGRVPSIKFLGKNGWASRRSGQEPTPAVPTSPTGAVTMDGSAITSNYGRPAFSEAEMEALMMGGANLVPKVLSTSGGAKFG
mmetsp:Transcript_9768/g.13781  ORF Transcript_9768/g.13781 Transcript_9768/m.13781 type:complete len:261 (-) Transcript_9768:215-997(-)